MEEKDLPGMLRMLGRIQAVTHWAKTLNRAAEEIERVRKERDEARSIIESCCEAVWEGCDIDGGTFQDWLVEAGMLVEVPSDEWFRETWGDDAKTMFSLAWSKYVIETKARESGGEGE